MTTTLLGACALDIIYLLVGRYRFMCFLLKSIWWEGEFLRCWMPLKFQILPPPPIHIKILIYPSLTSDLI